MNCLVPIAPLGSTSNSGLATWLAAIPSNEATFCARSERDDNIKDNTIKADVLNMVIVTQCLLTGPAGQYWSWRVSRGFSALYAGGSDRLRSPIKSTLSFVSSIGGVKMNELATSADRRLSYEFIVHELQVCMQRCF